MNNADRQYLNIAKEIIGNGYYGQNRTGNPTYKLPHKIMQFDLSEGFPILTTKFVAFKTAIKELLWIFRDGSNSVLKLREEGVNVWNEWEMEDGTIGTSYGYIVDKFDLLNKLIDTIKNDPQSRRMIMSLWQNEYLEGGALYPCAFMTMWDVTDGKLNTMLVQRSGDWGLGIPFNMAQYAALNYMIAHVTGLKPGLFTHVINNAHIYENQLPGMREQLTRYDETYEAPSVWINPEIKDFKDFTVDDIELKNYRHHKNISMPVSV